MALSVDVDPVLSDLFAALGLLDGDGDVDGSWFSDPLKAVRRALTNPAQRAAFVRLLDRALPPEAHPLAAPGSVWHPMLQPNRIGNVHVTVTGDVLGVALVAGTPPTTTPGAYVVVTLPLVDTGGGDVTTVAASPEHPLDVAVVATLGTGDGPDVVGVRVSVDVEGGVRVRVRLEDGTGDTRRVAELDPTRLDGEALAAVELLVRSVLDADDPGAEPADVGEQLLLRLVTHLFAVLGIGDPALPELPLARAVAEPAALRAWLTSILGDPEQRLAWFTHCAGLLGAAPLEQAVPDVSGTGEPGRPLRATIVELDDDVDARLDVTLAVDGDRLTIGVGVLADLGRGRLAADADLLALSLAGTAPAAVLPGVAVTVEVPVSADGADFGVITGGARWDGQTVRPLLRLDDVDVGGTRYTLDLSSAEAVAEAATDVVGGLIRDAIGRDSAGAHALALLGLGAPVGAAGVPVAGWPHLPGDILVSGDVLRAVAQMHRAVLDGSPADPDLTWRTMLAQLAGLVGLPPAASGTGTRTDPWRAMLLADGVVKLELVAWDDHDAVPAAPAAAGRHLLRIGVRGVAAEGSWTAAWTMEVAAFDLDPVAPVAARFLGSQALTVSLAGLAAAGEAGGPWVAADALTAGATWVRGRMPDAAVTVTGLALGIGPDALPPVTITLPPPSGFDPSQPDLGLGLGIADADAVVPALLRFLLAAAFRAAGSDGTAHAVAGLLGLHDDRTGLPHVWPSLLPADAAGLEVLLADPLTALGDHLRAVLTGTTGTGSPLLTAALPGLAGLLAGTAPTGPDAAPPDAERGVGSYDDPWVLPVVAGTGAGASTGLEVLVWQDPPPAPTTTAGATTGVSAAAMSGDDLAGAFAGFAGAAGDDVLTGLLGGRPAVLLGPALDDLAAELAASDGLVPFASATAVPPGWTTAAAVPCGHDRLPAHPAAVAATTAALAGWGSGPVVLVSAGTGGRRDWDALVTALEPGHDPDAELDLRGAGAGRAARIAALTAVARCYPVDLDDDGTGDVAALAAQVDAVADRVRALTGAATVRLVGHGAAGLAARVCGGRPPAVVAGVVTLGSAHDGTTAPAVSDAGLADVVRFAHGLLSASSGGSPAGSATADTLTLLARALDGGPARDGQLPAAGAHSPQGLSRPPADAAAGPAGLAIGGKLPADLVQVLAATRPPAAVPPPVAATHIGLGLRLPVPLPPAGPDQVTAGLTLRADVTRLRVADGPEPDRPRQRLTALLSAGRAGGWLAGTDGTDPTERGSARLRRADLGVRLDRTPQGLVVQPLVALHDAAAAGDTAARLDLATVTASLATRGAHVPLPAGLDGPAAGVVLDLLRALGVVVRDGGRDVVNVAAVKSIATTPAAALGPRAGAALDALAAAAGATGTPGGTWRLPAGDVELEVSRAPWTLRLGTRGAATDRSTRADGELTVALPSFTTTADVALVAGPARLAWRSQPRDLRLELPPWLPPLSLLPGGTASADAGAAALAALPRVLLTGLLAPFTGQVLGARIAAAPLDQLLTDPLRWVRPLDAAAVDSALAALGAALGCPDTGGLALPGGLSVRGVGDPVELRLTGTADLGDALDGTTLGVNLGLRPTGPDVAAGQITGVEPFGTLSFDITLPGSWGGVILEVGAGPAGIVLAVTPKGGTPPAGRIELLPHFSGLGALAAASTRLLPQVLQQLVTQLRPPPPAEPDGVLGAVLDVAEALELYADDADGFTRPERAARLAAMLQPAWWEEQVSSPAAVATAIGSVLSRLTLPVGAVTSSGGIVTWTVMLPDGAQVAVELGWTPAGHPTLLVTATGVMLGPVVLDTAALGYDGDLRAMLGLHLEVDGLLAPIRPALTVDVDGERYAVSVQPLGTGTADDLDLRLAPVPAVVPGRDAGLAVVSTWGVPLAVAVLVAVFGEADGHPLDKPLWGPPRTTLPGPSARALLVAAGLLAPGPAVALVNPLPEPATALLRGAQAAATGMGIVVASGPDADLTLALVSEPVQGGGVRTGISLRGWARIPGADADVTLRFGDAPWLDDADRGVTLWLLEPDDGDLPIRPTAALDIVGLGADVAGSDGDPLIDGTLTIGGIGGLLFLRADFFDDGVPKLTVGGLGAGIGVTDAFVDVSGEDADSFLRKVLPPQLGAPFDLTVIYRDGVLDIRGSDPAAPDRFELALPLDLDLTIVRITELLLGLRIRPTAALEAALSATASVGPIAANVRRVGVIAEFGGDRPGLRLRPPDQVGLSIDTSQLRLGGFVLVDEAHGRYVGAVEIAIAGKFELAAVALITTRMPDGSEGFSLLFIISIVFPTPISLGYGFFFAGAGGLLGLNRSVDLDRLRLGLRAGTADSILFPADIVRRADVIVRDLEQVFPVARGQFLVGPMAMITWSTPPLITLKLGIILEIGTPIRIAILGVLRAALPDAKEPVLDLKVAFLGTVDIGAKLLTFDAAIYDSYIGRGDLKLSLEGDIAVRLSWSDQPDFVTSVGGFHPAYKVPTHLKLPAMRRMSLSLLKDNPRITLSCYMAVTSNSVQFGARLQLFVGVAGFSVEGDLGFDVLFQFAPFLFDAAVWARLAVKAGGATLMAVSLDFSLRGPAPWVARGTASFTILFFTVRVAFAHRFGEEALDVADLVALLPKIRVEIERAENWQGTLPDAVDAAVSLLGVDPPGGHVVVDPGGALTFGQRVLPLATTITRFGTSTPSDVREIGLPAIQVGPTGLQTRIVTEPFSPAAFQDLSDADKLRAPAFERRAAGLRATTGTRLRAHYAVVRPARYDVIVRDTDDPATETRTPRATVAGEPFRRLVLGGAAGRSPAARTRRVAAEAPVVAAGAPTDLFGVTRSGDLRPLDAAGDPLDSTGTGPDGSPVWPEGALLQAADAAARAEALAAPGGALRVLPAAQLAAPAARTV